MLTVQMILVVNGTTHVCGKSSFWWVIFGSGCCEGLRLKHVVSGCESLQSPSHCVPCLCIALTTKAIWTFCFVRLRVLWLRTICLFGPCLLCSLQGPAPKRGAKQHEVAEPCITRPSDQGGRGGIMSAFAFGLKPQRTLCFRLDELLEKNILN